MRPAIQKIIMFALYALLLDSAAQASAARAEGSVGRGQAIYKDQCMACHAVDHNRIGPAHRGVFGRKAGTVPGYNYSPAFRRSKLVWNDRTLNQWLFNPEQLIPGQRMDYYLEQQQDRDDVIAYLKSLGPATPAPARSGPARIGPASSAPPCHPQAGRD